MKFLEFCWLFSKAIAYEYAGQGANIFVLAFSVISRASYKNVLKKVLIYFCFLVFCMLSLLSSFVCYHHHPYVSFLIAIHFQSVVNN